jgi:hypothetical protein
MTFCFYLIDETLNNNNDNQVNDTTVHSNTAEKKNQDDNPLECMLQIFLVQIIPIVFFLNNSIRFSYSCKNCSEAFSCFILFK